jgi:DegV family protein with EDD domain
MIYRILPAAQELPTTSGPSPSDYLEALQKMGQKYRAVLVITLSARLSTMFDSAKVAKEMAGERLQNTAVEVLDCGSAAGAQGLVVLAAAYAAAAGGDLAEVAQVARHVSAKVNLVAFLDTLYYLAKGGRVPKAIAWANSLVKVKPIFYIAPLSGEATTLKMARTRHGAVKQLLQMVKVQTEGRPVHAIVMHSHSLDEAERLKQCLADQLECNELYVSDLTPAMGIHTGPGVLGIAFYADD